ncbi:uncharacterized protein LOC114734738 isoform X2 [Neltuma alba]|uniref:uncharacterized protein LOC114734738 isoform X2 n=1 Tax=Neltuma alba TaxID=207710 RepID=UPI0010A57262|nr:uncharacterized protein LOC114734738 isoform X2 [Prosopis alba]
MALSPSLQNLSVTSVANGISNTTSRTRRRPSLAVHMATSDTSIGTFEEGRLVRPKWTGHTPISRLVVALISFKPLYSILKLGARQVLISTAEKNNIPWREMAKEILESDAYKELESIRDHSLEYPDSAEAEAATLSMVRRAIPDASSVDEANQILRGNWLQAIEQHHLKYTKTSMINDILDIGCSVGESTRHLAAKFPNAKVTGLDLSPYFLAVAQLKEKNRAPRKHPISWIHANGENTGLPSKSFDLVSISFVLHECPERAIVNMIKEAFRLLRPGGTIALTDNSPKSKILQELPPVLFTLLKSTEPFIDEYYLTDMEATLRQAGFVNIQSILTDPRHMTATATVPY